MTHCPISASLTEKVSAKAAFFTNGTSIEPREENKT